jgi:hypothetical protein
MRPKSVTRRQGKEPQPRYVVRHLRWTPEERQMWLEDVMKLLIDLYVEQEELEQELPLFDFSKKSK